MRNLTLIGLLLAAGCEGREGDGLPDAGPDAMLVESGVIQLGTGTLDFEPVEAEGELGLVAGPQGGFHFIVHARMQMMAPGNPDDAPSTPSTRFYAYREDGTQIDLRNPAYRIAYEDVGDGWYELPGGRILQIGNEYEPGIYGSRIRIRVTIIDNQARYADDERWVVVYDYCERFPDECSFGAPAPSPAP
jgi:hypothetical protein